MASRVILLILILIASVSAGEWSEIRGTGQLRKDIQFWYKSHAAMRPNEQAVAAPFGDERVRLDLSVDDGATWDHQLAYGIMPDLGTNTFRTYINVTRDMWTETARVAVRTLWSSSTNAILQHQGDMSDSAFSICGLHIVSPAPGSSVSMPSYLPLRFYEAGFDTVDIFISTNAPSASNPPVVQHVATLSTPGVATNDYDVPLVDLPYGPLWLIVAGDTNFYAIIDLNLIPW